MSPLRIVSINTGKGDGAFRSRVELLGERLSALNADIVLIQESLKNTNGKLDTTRSLAEHLSLLPSYVPARFKGRDVEGDWLNTWSGMGLLSREVPDEVVAVHLPEDPRDGERVALVAKFGDLAIANVHLMHLRDGEAVLLRRQQVETLLASDALLGSRNVLIGGDFNTQLGGIAELLAGIGDWIATDAFGSQTTNRATVPVSAPANEGYCLDFIFALTRPGQTLPSFSDSQVVLAEPDASGVYPSDHRGILTTVTFSNDLEQAQ